MIFRLVFRKKFSKIFRGLQPPNNPLVDPPLVEIMEGYELIEYVYLIDEKNFLDKFSRQIIGS